MRTAAEPTCSLGLIEDRTEEAGRGSGRSGVQDLMDLAEGREMTIAEVKDRLGLS